MKMVSKRAAWSALLLACALVALTALPAMASANVTLTKEGVAMNAGDPVTAEGTDLKFTSEGGAGPTLGCANVFINGEVGINGTEPAAIINGLGAGEECHAGETPVPWEEIVMSELRLFGDGSGSAQLIIHWNIAKALFCTWTATNAPLTWEPSGRITVEPTALTGSGDEGCPANGTLTGHVHLSSGGVPVTIG